MTEMLEFAIETARAAGRLLCEFSDRQHQVGHKQSEIDLVTEADFASEKLIVNAVHAAFPGQPVLSEEGLGDLADPTALDHGSPGSSSGVAVWLVDPLDGTVNYAHGYPIWSVTLALVMGVTITLGVTYDPLRQQMFWAERGAGAWCNGRRLRVSGAACLADALLATGFPYTRATDPDNNLAEFNALMPRVHGVRRAGSAALDLAHVAAGWLDGYWERGLRPWDYAAGLLLVEESGGTVTGPDGKPFVLGRERVVASNGYLHQELLEALARARR
jgi:myo-inositol-1(or 4)-monophosphatase